MPRIGSPTAAIRSGIVSTVNASGLDGRDLVPAKRRGDARVGRRAHRVRGRDRAVARVLAEVDEHADAVGDAPGRRRDALVADAPLDLLGERLREPPHVAGTRAPAGSARGCAARSRPRSSGTTRSPSSSITSRTTSAISRTNGHWPSRRRVEVDQQVVGPLDLRHARVPRVQLDAAEVRDPGERGRVVDDREHRRVAARELHEHLVDVVRVVRRHALLVEELPLDAVREPLHVERPAAQVGEGAVGDRRGSTRRGRPSSARARGRTACPGSRPGRRGGRRAPREYREADAGTRHPLTDVTLEPLDDYLVVEPLDESRDRRAG